MNSEEHVDAVRRLIEESSLGTEGAKALRTRTDRRAVTDFRRRRAESVDCGSLADAEPDRAGVDDADRHAFPRCGADRD